jgi:hypothetical protein
MPPFYHPIILRNNNDSEEMLFRMKNNSATIGLIVNVVYAVFLLLFAVRHPHWETLQLSPDARRIYYEKLLHIVVNQALPWTSGAMAFSAYLFWKLRK